MNVSPFSLLTQYILATYYFIMLLYVTPDLINGGLLKASYE